MCYSPWKIKSKVIKSVITPLARSVLIPLGLTAAASVPVAGIHKKILGPGNSTTLIKAFKIASDQKYDGYQRGLASMV